MFSIGGSRIVKLMKIPSSTINLSKIVCRNFSNANNKGILLSHPTQSIRFFSNEV